ncbi:iron-sulfur cluster assembly protein, partial [candidate division KSB1 bacterium]
MSTSINSPTQEQILTTLKGITFPKLSRDIVSFGLVKGIEIENGLVRVKIQVATRDPNIPVQIEKDVHQALHQISGVRDVHVDMNWIQPE